MSPFLPFVKGNPRAGITRGLGHKSGLSSYTPFQGYFYEGIGRNNCAVDGRGCAHPLARIATRKAHWQAHRTVN